jgi:3-carboxy-cis,cis-muconate cycloisomerase
MPASPLDSALYGKLFGDAELARLFSDTAEVRAMLLVEGALAKVQGQLGLIPETSGAFLHRAAMEVQIDPAGLAEATGRNAVPVPGLVAATRKALEAPEHAAWLHFGATSQDIVDTALVLRLGQTIALYEARLPAVTGALGRLAEAHAELPMMARTYGQDAVPSSFGAQVAIWGAPLLRHRERLAELKPRLLVVSLSGAAGTLSAMGPKGPEVRAALAEALGLGDPGESWHAARDRVAEFAFWCAGLMASLGKLAEDLILMTSSPRGEVVLGAAGGSSTMPQKQNPVGPSALAALSQLAQALAGALGQASAPREARDGAAWMTEWLTLPQLCLATGRGLLIAGELAGMLAPSPAGLRRPLDEGPRLWAAEALTFALAEAMPRPTAEAEVKRLVAEALASGTPLPALAAKAHPGTDWHARLAPEALLGEAPALARRFAAAAKGG